MTMTIDEAKRILNDLADDCSWSKDQQSTASSILLKRLDEMEQEKQINRKVCDAVEETRQKVSSAIEQLRDIYCGRHTYLADQEWLDNVDAAFKELCDLQGIDFQSTHPNAPIRTPPPTQYNRPSDAARQLAFFLAGESWHDEHGWKILWENGLIPSPAAWMRNTGVSVLTEERKKFSAHPSLQSGMRRRWMAICAYAKIDAPQGNELWEGSKPP